LTIDESPIPLDQASVAPTSCAVSAMMMRQIMQERRSITRRRSYLGGRMIFKDAHVTVDCLVRDFTDSGVRVECPPDVLLPRELDIAIDSKGVQAQARVIWRQGHQLGLAFETEAGTTGHDAMPIGTEHLIAVLRAANADLRRRVSPVSRDR
jgi:hypothetical protein